MAFGYRLRGLVSPLLNGGNIGYFLDTITRGATEVCEEFYDTLSDTAMMQGYPVEEIEIGERIMQSEFTEHKYRVPSWVDKGDGRFVALEKALIDIILAFRSYDATDQFQYDGRNPATVTVGGIVREVDIVVGGPKADFDDGLSIRLYHHLEA